MMYKLPLNRRKATFIKTILLKIQADGPQFGMYNVDLGDDADDESDAADITETELEELIEDLNRFE